MLQRQVSADGYRLLWKMKILLRTSSHSRGFTGHKVISASPALLTSIILAALMELSKTYFPCLFYYESILRMLYGFKWLIMDYLLILGNCAYGIYICFVYLLVVTKVQY